MPPPEDHVEIKRLLEENAKLIVENNRLLKRLYRWTVLNVIIKMVWFFLLIGLPFALYFYVFEPYFEAFGSSYEVFITGLNELPGLKGIDQLMNGTFERMDR